MGEQDAEAIKHTILALEKGAMQSWRSGDPWGFIELYMRLGGQWRIIHNHCRSSKAKGCRYPTLKTCICRQRILNTLC